MREFATTTGSRAARLTQPARSTCTQGPFSPSFVSRNPSASLAMIIPPGAARRFSSGARVTARSNPARGVTPTDVPKIQPSSVTPIHSPLVSPPVTTAPRARRASRLPVTSW